jgi:hypothetical protein
VPARLTLRQRLMQLIAAFHARGAPTVARQLCIALANLAVVDEHWSDVIVSCAQGFSTLAQREMLLEVLKCVQASRARTCTDTHGNRRARTLLFVVAAVGKSPRRPATEKRARTARVSLSQVLPRPAAPARPQHDLGRTLAGAADAAVDLLAARAQAYPALPHRAKPRGSPEVAQSASFRLARACVHVCACVRVCVCVRTCVCADARVFLLLGGGFAMAASCSAAFGKAHHPAAHVHPTGRCAHARFLTHAHAHSLAHSLTHSIAHTHALTHPLTHSLARSLAHSLAHSLTHSPPARPPAHPFARRSSTASPSGCASATWTARP